MHLQGAKTKIKGVKNMNLKDAIISANVSSGVGKKSEKPYTCIDVVFKGENGTVISKRVFLQEFEKQLLNIA